MKFTQICFLLITSILANENTQDSLKKSNWWWNRPAPVPAADPLATPLDPLSSDPVAYRSSFSRRYSTFSNGFGF